MRLTFYSCLGSIEQIDEALVASSLHLLDLGTILVDLESGHALDSGRLGTLGVGINIELLHDKLRVVVHLLNKNGSNALAGWAPGGGEVDDEGFATIGGSLNSGIESCLVGKVVIVGHIRSSYC